MYLIFYIVKYFYKKYKRLTIYSFLYYFTILFEKAAKGATSIPINMNDRVKENCYIYVNYKIL